MTHLSKTSAAVAVVALWLTKAAADPLAAALQQNTTAPSAAASPHYSASVGYICAAVSILAIASKRVSAPS